MNLKHAQYMMTILQEGSITAAAKKLFISQPSLSQMVKLVETNLGTAVFNRTTEPLSLTPAGEKYMEAAGQILAIHANLEREIEEIRAEEHGKIKFGIPVQRGMMLLPLALPRFFEAYPHVTVELFEHGFQPNGTYGVKRNGGSGLHDYVARHEELTYQLLEMKSWFFWPPALPVWLPESQTEPPFLLRRRKMSVLLPTSRATTSAPSRTAFLLQAESSRRSFWKREASKWDAASAMACGAVMLFPKSCIENTEELKEKACVYPVLNSATDRHCYLCFKKGLYLTKYMRDFMDFLLNAKSGL